MVCPEGRSSLACDGVALREHRQQRFAVLELGFGVVGAFDVRAEVTGELDGAARRLEHRGLAAGRGRGQTERDAPDAGVGHLRRDRALPDEVVEAALVGTAELTGDVVDGAHAVSRGADRLVSLLRVLDLAAVLTRLGGEVVVAVHALDLAAGGSHRLSRERGGVGTHVGDEAALVEPLCHVHRARRAEAEFATGLLLQRGSDERRLGSLRLRCASPPTRP